MSMETSAKEQVRRFKPYLAYKDSGVEWLGEIPAHWDSGPVKGAFDIQLGKMLQNEPAGPLDLEVRYFKAAHVQWHAVSSDDLPTMWASSSELTTYEVRRGDLLVCEGGEGGRCGVVGDVPERAIIQNALHRVRAKTGASVRFLEHVMRTASSLGWFEVLNNKATIAHFTREKLAALRIPLPDDKEQRAIAVFLDRETARIDGLVAKKERLIELLQEKRTALITRAVTKGLDPNVPMKDSGVEWLGEIPAHWEAKRLKHVASKIGSGKTPSGGAEVYVQEGVMLLRSQNIHFAGLRLEDVAFIDPDTDAEMAGSRVREHDVLLNITGASLGRCCVAHLDGRAANVNQHVCVIRPHNGQFEPAFLAAAIASQSGQDQIFLTENGISRDALNFDQIGDLSLGRPPVKEQCAIAAFLDQETARIDALIAKVREAIDRLKELRTALISAAVTGKIDVRGEVA